VQNREAEIRAINPFRAALLILLAVSVSISARRYGLAMRIWLGLPVVLVQTAVKAS